MKLFLLLFGGAGCLLCVPSFLPLDRVDDELLSRQSERRVGAYILAADMFLAVVWLVVRST
jgi:hypothetical protein